MITNLSKKLVYACLMSAQLLTYSTAFAKSGGGAIAGGGGDATEERVNEIRADLLKWIKNDGAKDLTLPSTLSYGEYVSKMKDILQAQKVVIGFVEKDDATNEELQVNVNGMPKTCRGFISKEDSRFHILCNITRFINTPESAQYRLIHHEYAGLVNVENNDEAASDYAISSQITDYLSMQTVLRLAVKGQVRNENSEELKMIVTKSKYLGDKKFEVELTLNHPENVLQVTMENKGIRKSPKIVLRDNNFSFTKIVDLKKSEYREDYDVEYNSVIAQFTDGSAEMMKAVQYKVQDELLNFYYGETAKGDLQGLIKYKNLGTQPGVKKQEDIKVKYYNIKYDITYNTAALDLSDYRGVLISNERGAYEEFLSEDPAELTKFLESKKIGREVVYQQSIRGYAIGCSDIIDFCLHQGNKLDKNFYTENNTRFIVKFLTKGNITQQRMSIMDIPVELPAKP